MKIVHYLMHVRLRDGGVVRAVLDLCTLLASAGHEVTLMCCGEPETPKDWAEPGARAPKVVRLDAPGAGGLLPRTAVASAKKVLSSADVAHFHGMWELSNHQLASACRRLGKPYVYSPHGMLDDWSMSQGPFKKRVFLAVAAGRSLHAAQAVHCTAAAELEQAKRWAPGIRGAVAPLLLDFAPYESPPGPELARRRFAPLNTPRPVVLFLSRLHPKKRPDVLIRAARLLKDRGIDAIFAIAGGGEPHYIESLERQIESSAVGDRVHLLGMVVGAEKVSLYQAASAMAIPTSQENFGFVFFEALAAGTPVLTTRGVDTWPELLESGGAALAEPTPEAFADALADLLQDPNRLREMGKAGRAWVFQRLSPGSIIDTYLAIYRGEVSPR